MSKDMKEKKKLSARLRRDFRYGTNSIVLIAAVLVVFVVLNLVLENFGSSLTLDLTKEKLYSIGDVTTENLNALEQDVEVIALYDRVKGEADSNRVEVIKILDLYDEFEHVSVSYKDPDSNPGLIREKVGETEAASYEEGDYIVKCGDKTRRIGEDDMFVYETYQYFYQYKSAIQVEQKLTSAILFVTSDEYPVIYCTTGHGEESRNDFSKLFNGIELLGCDIQELNLTEAEAIPEDATVLIFLSPKYDLTDTERSMVEQWLVQDGGQMIFCADPDQAGTAFTNFNKILTEQFGLAINSDLVMDSEKKLAAAANANSFEGISVANGPIAEMGGYPIYLFSTRSVEVLSQDSATTYIENYPIIQTEETAKATSVLDKSETEGVLTVAAAATNTKYLNTIHGAVFGSTLGLTDSYYEQFGYLVYNAISVFAYSIDWMISDYGENEGNLIDIKTYDTAVVTVEEGQSRLLAIVAMVVIPVLIIGIGVVVWFRRRHL